MSKLILIILMTYNTIKTKNTPKSDLSLTPNLGQFKQSKLKIMKEIEAHPNLH